MRMANCSRGGALRSTTTCVGLIFGSNARLQAVGDGEERFVRDFSFARDKVMMHDCFDLA
jgi:catalase (peroxidase I)